MSLFLQSHIHVGGFLLLFPLLLVINFFLFADFCFGVGLACLISNFFNRSRRSRYGRSMQYNLFNSQDRGGRDRRIVGSGGTRNGEIYIVIVICTANKPMCLSTNPSSSEVDRRKSTHPTNSYPHFEPNPFHCGSSNNQALDTSN